MQSDLNKALASGKKISQSNLIWAHIEDAFIFSLLKTTTHALPHHIKGNY